MRLTDAEWHIMNALWRDYPATAREIAERLPPGIDWAYTTIKTLISRLVEKKAITERKRANTSVYQPILSQEKARRGALRALVNHAFGGALGPLMLFLVEDQKLSPRERSAVLEGLRRYEKPEKGD